MKLFRSLEEVVRPTDKGGSGLGTGSFAKVTLVSHISDPGKLYAMKEVEKRTPKSIQLLQKEVKLHSALNHPHIIKFVDSIDTPNKMYIFLEYAKSGDMYTYINKNKLTEDECLRLFYQTCEGIAYIHSRNVMHRDLKPENILLDENLNVKICDFGWSAEYLPTEIRQTLCGTYEYMAPEIFFRKQQTKKTDIWALGILLYELFHGHAPFRGTKMEDVLANIMKNSIAFRKTIDPQIRDLIVNILNFEAPGRPTIEEILSSPVITSHLEKFPEDKVDFVYDCSAPLSFSNSPCESPNKSSNFDSGKRPISKFGLLVLNLKKGKESGITSSLTKQSSQEENKDPKKSVFSKFSTLGKLPRAMEEKKIGFQENEREVRKSLASAFSMIDIGKKLNSNQSFTSYLGKATKPS